LTSVTIFLFFSNSGPESWHREFPVAKEGKRQSPIDIIPDDTVDATSASKEKPLKWTYGTKHCMNIENTGSSWKVNVNGCGSSLVGGPLMNDEYELWQFHAHWGNDSSKGSEHTVDGKTYAAELHLVHWNKKYENPNTAAGQPDGLAVLGMFIEVGEANEELDKVVQALGLIKNKNDKHPIEDQGIDCNNLLPKEHGFWTYDGSLTTPPLLESVTWIVFQKPIQVSEEQMIAMRNMNFGTDDSEKMVNNYRPPCTLGDRNVRKM
jgi:carbonic anhydrase